MFFVKWQSSFSLLLVKSEKIIFGRYIFRASSSLLISPLVSTKAYCIHSFWSQNTEKRNTTISQMRLRSVFKMRMSILNTATTEQMGYGMVSFFVCFLLMNRNPFQNFTLGFYELFIFFPAVLLIFQRDILWCYALYKFPDTFSDKRLMQINMTGMVICKAK